MKYRFLLALACLTISASILPTHAAQHRPNILFAIADDMGRHGGAYGTPWVRTPNLDRVAAQGILFLNAYTPSAKCAPSRSVIMTGRNPWQLKEAANHQPYYPKEFKSWMEVLDENGYFVGYTGKAWGPGELPAERANISGRNFDRHQTKPPAKGINGIDYAENFKTFMKERPKDQPFVFWYGCKEPHRGYEFQSGVNKGGYKLDDVDHVPAYWPDIDEVRHDMLDYALEVNYFDAHLGRILDHLEALGELDNTLVVVTSDNGPPFPRMKGHPFDQATHLPLVVMGPADLIKAPGRKSASMVTFADYAPTFLDVAGVDGEANGMAPIEGRSLRDVFEGGDIDGVIEAREAAYLGRERNDVLARLGSPSGLGYPVRAIRKGDFMYLHNFEADRWPCGDPVLGLTDTDGSPTKSAITGAGAEAATYQFCFGKRYADELYHVGNDPDCVVNLAEEPDYKGLAATLKAELFAELKRQKDPRMFGQGDVFDQYRSPKEERNLGRVEQALKKDRKEK